MSNKTIQQLEALHEKLRACRSCKSMQGRAVHGPALHTKVMLIGQAPGIHEGTYGRPFAHTAGRTLFKWLRDATGETEEELRRTIYFSAVARCFPGKSQTGKGDRAPNNDEIANCRTYLRAEVEALQPEVILAVGKIAISEVLASAGIKKNVRLEELVGRRIRAIFHHHTVTVIPLPHPSGISRWPQIEPGRSRLKEALELVRIELAAHT